MGELENSSPMAVSIASAGEASVSSSGYQTTPVPVDAVLPKKKRNLPGMPDPGAEVIALSPKTLMATNRFVCEICNKGFQRDQNLQLHRRGHNLPWKLRQRTTKEIRKKVYVCPEASCVHHNPARALGDLTGIKKHFCRKHGEKKWKCERCSKKYAVQSDWKAHMKTCGTREYKCDCGTLFSRRDSFITHRAFCDALAEESARSQTLAISSDAGNSNVKVAVASPPPPPLTPSASVMSPSLSIQSSELPDNGVGLSPPTPAATTVLTTNSTATTCSSSNGSSTSTVFASIFAPSSVAPVPHPSHALANSSFSNLMAGRSHCSTTLPTVADLEPTSLSLSTSLYLSNNGGSSLYQTQDQPEHRNFSSSPLQPPAMSATALLQKAAQMGAAASNASLLCSFGLTTSTSSSSGKDSLATQWNSTQIKPESVASTVAAGLGLGLQSGGNSGLTDLVMGPSLTFGSQPMTRDLLGLSIGGGGGGGGGVGASTGGLSALLNSLGGSGGFDITAPSTYGGGGGRSSPGGTWEGQQERKPNGPALL
ncbi:zinc finger protein GAI-ASSOCIATED FACTOR 1-like [Humulus lupulus]|uniref:zinc finger protein GAI-ASSOCIATED FACTOR 1-like n=1 Tax=Humulus lupulus TaxID=3486 RepID=UPI002B40CE13|nr:zinc finger protein GAI-ASSOCIATED FACTOR 1-like [Humulus lupulus]